MLNLYRDYMHQEYYLNLTPNDEEFKSIIVSDEYHPARNRLDIHFTQNQSICTGTAKSLHHLHVRLFNFTVQQNTLISLLRFLGYTTRIRYFNYSNNINHQYIYHQLAEHSNPELENYPKPTPKLNHPWKKGF